MKPVINTRASTRINPHQLNTISEMNLTDWQSSATPMLTKIQAK